MSCAPIHRKSILLPHSMETAKSLNFKRNGTVTMIWDRRTWLWNWKLSGVVFTKLTIAKKPKRSTQKKQKGMRKRRRRRHQLHGAISEYKWVLHCEGYDYEELPDKILEAPLSQRFFTRRMKMLSRPDSFILSVKLGVYFFSTSELVYPKMKIRLRLITARSNFYVISDNPNVSLGIVDCSLQARRITLKDDFHKKWIDMLGLTPVEINYWNLLERLSSFPPDKTSSFKKTFSTMLQFVGLLLQWLQTCIGWIVYWKYILISTIWSQTN